ncbi:hypothetical protein GCM10007962_00930 [Yeosuana aromativorans]|uniref:HTH araC/xylS-type domain-containing protein n=1 Tax=Yeosuana aromativorans TaxID=288019 RepID=A0A8J3BBS0_9FLAO|nr:tetratricopeptide repeat protein [Yeosuana aromativorans]GGK10624.1 hypothetical protein GCM10007962_00930 [Yeosuana aromativorans]
MKKKELYNFSSKSIAVLPFSNFSNDLSNDYFTDGITEEIINALTSIKGLKVTARTSSFAFKNKHIDVRDIGNQLGVATILEGSVRFQKNKVRITTQLVRTEDGFYIWSNSFNRDLEDIFDLQNEISLLIAEQIREHFGHFEIEDHLLTIDTKSVEAYKLYLKGRYLRLKWNNANVSDAITYFKQSIKIDPNFSDAYFELGWCFGMLASWGYIEKTQGIENANYFINLGSELNPESYLGYYAKATVSFWGHWNYKDTYYFLEKSLALNPNFSEIYNATTDLYSSLGHLNKALKENEKALKVDPLSVNHHFTKGNLYYFLKEYDKAIKAFDKALELNPSFPLGLEMKAAALILSKQEKKLSEFIKETPQLEKPHVYKDLYNLIHKKTVFKIEHREVNENTANNDPAYISLRLWNLYLQIYLGNHELALDILSEKIKSKSGQIFNFKNDPFLNPLRKYERFKQIEKKVFSKELVPKLTKEINKKESTSLLDDQQIEHYILSLKKVLEVDKVFLNSNLSLKTLAEAIDLHPNKLSWLLNEAMGKNFNDYVNSFRLNYFQHIAQLPENSNITLLGLAFESGFNSKTVFNTFFKKETGLTPRAWLNTYK